MLTKVSYNAYASSASGIKKQNQPQNVNFGINAEQIGKLAELAQKMRPKGEDELLTLLSFLRANPGLTAQEVFTGMTKNFPFDSVLLAKAAGNE